MKYRQLGKSDLWVSEISFGGMSLEEDSEQNLWILHRALEGGINFFDTADLYQKGWNEEMIGKAFRDRRDKVLLATKVGNQWREDGSGWDWNPSKKYILEAVEKSLERLQTDYIDLYQLHGGTIEDPMEETIEAFELLRQQGKIRYYGISSIRPNVIREWVRRSGMVSVMMQYSLLDRRPEEACLDLLRENGIGVLARGSLARGLLLGKKAVPYLDFSEEEVNRAARKIKEVAEKDRQEGQARLPAEVALRFVTHHPAISSAVVGIRTPEQLDQALKAGESLPLSEEEIQLLRRAVRPLQYDQHR